MVGRFTIRYLKQKLITYTYCLVDITPPNIKGGMSVEKEKENASSSGANPHYHDLKS